MMDAATFIDVVLTPVGGGIGAFLATRFVQRRNGSTPSQKHQPLLVGVCVAAVLFALKFFSLLD